MANEIDARIRRANEVIVNLTKIRKQMKTGGNKNERVQNELLMVESMLCMEIELLLKVLKIENTEYPGFKKTREELINAR